MSKRFIYFLFVIFISHLGNAQNAAGKYLKLTLHNGMDISFVLKEHPSITFMGDSLSIVAGDSYAKAKRLDIKNITFPTEMETLTVHGSVSDGKYYRLRGVSGKYVNAAEVNEGKLLMQSLVESNNAGTIFYYKDRSLLNYATGTYIDANGEIGTISSSKGQYDFLVSSDFSNKFTLKNADGTILSDKGGSLVAGNPVAANVDNELFTIEEVTHLPIKMTEFGYATFYAPVAVQLPEELQAHTIAIVNSEYVALSEGFGTVPAYTGVIISGPEGVYDATITDGTGNVGTIMTGTVAKTLIYEEGYVLSAPDNQVGLYKALLNCENNTAFINNSHKAYLPMSSVSASQSNGFRFGTGDTTGIGFVEAYDNVDIYDLNGQLVETVIRPGVYIVNGKKMYIFK